MAESFHTDRYPTESAARKCMNVLIDLMPHDIVLSLLQRAALCPPSVKTHLFERLCTRLASSGSFARELSVVSNLGISARLRCELPLAKFSYTFGRPSNNLAERSTIAIVLELSKDCRHFLDVGANEAIFTFLVGARKVAGSPGLHWFEPDERLFRRAQGNLARNSIEAAGNMSALTSFQGKARFHRNLSDDASGSLSDVFLRKHRVLEELVNVTTLSEYLCANVIEDALVKVDVEGSGADVWKGAAASHRCIKYLVIEMLEAEIRSELPRRIISETGWFAYYLRDFEILPSVNGEFEYRAPFWNWLFCDLPPDALSARLRKTRFRVVRTEELCTAA